MAFYTDGVVPWNSLDNNTRAPLASELENGYPCGEADQELFNWTAGWPVGNIWNMILQSGITPDTDKLLDLARAIQSGKVNFAVAGGTANALTAALSPTPAALTQGMLVTTRITSANTGAMTLNVNGLGSIPARDAKGMDFIANSWAANDVVTWAYNGSEWRAQTVQKGQQAAVFSTPGTFSWVCPSGVRQVLAKVWGGGGAGGSTASSPNSTGASGGGGGYTEGLIDVIPGTSYAVSVGSGGVAGTPGSSPQPSTGGGTSGFAGVLSATGGGAGLAAAGAIQNVTPVGGVGSGGYFNFAGGTGGSAFATTTEMIVPPGGYAYAVSLQFYAAVGALLNGRAGLTPGGGGGAGYLGGAGGAGGNGRVILQF